MLAVVVVTERIQWIDLVKEWLKERSPYAVFCSGREEGEKQSEVEEKRVLESSQEEE